jgi:hypothetical protein
MTRQQAEDDEDSEYAANVELARLLKIMIRKKQREHLPRYKGRSRVAGKIAAYCRDSDPNMVELRVSYDIVKQWYSWIMHFPEPVSDLLPGHYTDLRMHAIRFTKKSVPIVLLRLEDVSLRPCGHRLVKRPKSWQFSAKFKGNHLGLITEAGSIPSLDLVPWPAMAGHCAIIPPSHRIWLGKHIADPRGFLEELIDPNEPPRFKGRMDPAYAASLSQGS